MSDDHTPGLFAPWRFRPTGGDFSPGGWYFRDASGAQNGPHATRADAKAVAKILRKAFGLYQVNGEGSRLVHIDGPATAWDHLDARAWTAGSMDEDDRFSVLWDDQWIADAGDLEDALAAIETHRLALERPAA